MITEKIEDNFRLTLKRRTEKYLTHERKARNNLNQKRGHRNILTALV